jgi:predicted phosphodiesterase
MTAILKRSRSRSRSSSPPQKRQKAVSKPVRFLILSDTHDCVLSSLPECDVVLHCGDLTEDGSPASITAALQMLGKVNAELKLVIAGNHEISLDKEYYLAEGGQPAKYEESRALVFGPDSEAKRNGVTYLDEGIRKFELRSGATFRIYTSQWTPKYGSSAFQYPTSEDRFNSTSPAWANNVATEQSLIPNDVDIIMTHGPPKYVLDDTGDGGSAGCEHLRRAIARVKPRIHCFGHVHRGYGAQRIRFDTSKKDGTDSIVPLSKEWVGKNQAKKKGYASLPPSSAEAFRTSQQTLMINAAIENEEEGNNMPWLVDLDLPLDSTRT